MDSTLPSSHDHSRQRRVQGGRWLRSALAALFAVAILRLLGWSDPVVEVVAEIRSLAGADGEIFYAGAGEGYHPDRRVPFSIEPDGKWHTYRVGIPEHDGLDRIRIDPGSSSGTVEMRRIAIAATGNSVDLAGNELSASMGALNSMRAEAGNQANLRFEATAPDPFVDFKLPGGAGQPSQGGQSLRWLGAAVAAGLLWLLLAEVAFPRVTGRLAPYLKLPKLLHRAAARVSDPGVLIVPPQAMATVGLMLFGAVLYIALNLHQSSIGVWEEIYPAKPIEQLVDLGSPKHIRSDEWNTQAPWVLGQVARGKLDQNLSIGGQEAPLLASVPVFHSSGIAQVKFYGFYLFDAETGFSWWWAYKSFGLLLSFFWLFLILTRGNYPASMLGALWIYGSSSTQWWFSSYTPELLIAFALATVGGIYLLFARRRLMMALGAALVAYSVLNLLLHLYPPIIVPFAYLGAAILGGLLLEPGRFSLMQQDLRWRAVCLSAAVLTVAVIGGKYLFDALPTIEVMANTVYPGRRFSAGGDFPAARLMYGFFEAFRVGEGRFPLPPTNASEASSFIILVPLALLVLRFTAFFRRKNALLSTLTFYCLVLGLWISVPLPSAAEKILQYIGLSWSPPSRSVFGFGVGSIIAVTVLFSRIVDGTADVRALSARKMVPVMVLSCLMLFGWVLNGMDPVFFRPKIVVFASVVVATMAAGIVLGRHGLFAVGLAFAIAPALLVNPLVSGLSAIEDKPILLAAKNQGGALHDRWAVVGDFVLSQGLKAHGLEVVSGSQIVPNLQTARLLDPQRKYESTWNRYAHVGFNSDPAATVPVYSLVANDVYVISLNVCSQVFRQLGVTHLAYSTPVPPPDLSCLIELGAPLDSGVRLFRLLPPARTVPSP